MRGIQTVAREPNSDFWNLLEAFRLRSGCPYCSTPRSITPRTRSPAPQLTPSRRTCTSGEVRSVVATWNPMLRWLRGNNIDHLPKRTHVAYVVQQATLQTPYFLSTTFGYGAHAQLASPGSTRRVPPWRCRTSAVSWSTSTVSCPHLHGDARIRCSVRPCQLCTRLSATVMLSSPCRPTRAYA
jgi:hypothetical protein